VQQTAIHASMRMNAEGIKGLISGRLNGAEMVCPEGFKAKELYQLLSYITDGGH
jgi:ribosomal protein S3